MKVGIISMQRVFNYGSFMQAYSLKKNIGMLGHEAEFVDYHAGEPLITENVSGNSKLDIKEAIGKLIPPYINSKKVMNEYWNNMGRCEERYIGKYLPMIGVTSEKKYNTKEDVIVIGSDEVFNCVQSNPDVGFSPELFGAHRNAKRVISYAGSFGNTTINEIDRHGKREELTRYFNDFSDISVRDKNSVSIIQELTGKTPEYHIDPVFLYDYENEIPKKAPKKDYIVVYAYQCRLKKSECRKISRFAKKHNKKIVCLCGPQRYLKGYVAADPFEVLWYIKNADFVITDTFHGSVFSIKFNRQFAVLLRKGNGKVYGNNEKLFDLLRRFGVEDQVVNGRKIDDVIFNKIDYKSINEQIKRERENSLNYLKKAIGE